MTIDRIEQLFKDKVSNKISLLPEGIDRYQVITPFMFDDGDHLIIVLKTKNNDWFLSDEGHTYMHLSYKIDEKFLQSGNRQKIISNVLSVYDVYDDKGELIIKIRDELFGDFLFSFIQALLKITDVSYLSRDRVISTFFDDFRIFIENTIPENRRQFDWYHPKLDGQGNYGVDCRLNGQPKPVFIHALNNDEKTQTATISLLNFDKWDIKFDSVAIFEDQEQINRKVLARFSDVGGKQFSNLPANRIKISKYLKELLI